VTMRLSQIGEIHNLTISPTETSNLIEHLLVSTSGTPICLN